METQRIEHFLGKILLEEPIEAVVLGYPACNDGMINKDVENVYQRIIQYVKSNFPSVLIHRVDERFTSKMAQRVLVESGMKKKDRQKKENLDQVSAAIILQDYLETRKKPF